MQEQANAAINGALYEPDPSDETGLNARFRPPVETSAMPKQHNVTHTTPPKSEHRQDSGSHNPFNHNHEHGAAKETASASTKELAPDRKHPSPPSLSPRASPSHRQQAFASHNTTRPRRSSSLKERFPGDPSPYPLDQLAREKAVADRARHITKNHAIRPDTIDSLDQSGLGLGYHHEGPYDATLFARNNSSKLSPVAAVADSNNEALKATPHEKIIDSVRGHRPLDGVAAYPPGETDRNGQTFHYQEGENMMVDLNPEGGAYKRWPGVQYHPDDIKGKGEPSYSIEKALKEHSLEDKPDHKRDPTVGGIELKSNHSRHSSGASPFVDDGADLNRRGSLSNRLKKRVGSLKKKLTTDE